MVFRDKHTLSCRNSYASQSMIQNNSIAQLKLNMYRWHYSTQLAALCMSELV